MNFTWKYWLIATIGLIMIWNFYYSFSFDERTDTSNSYDEDTDTLIENEVETKLTEFEKDFLLTENSFYWGHMPITYHFSEGCVGPIVYRIVWSFDILTNDTNRIVRFKELNSSVADINFVCYRENNREPIDKYSSEYTQGLSTYELYSNGLIDEAKIEFWSVGNETRPTSCNTFPRLELHEILHILGFNHIDDYYSIMYPQSVGCVAKEGIITRNNKTFTPEDKVDDEIIHDLIIIYG